MVDLDGLKLLMRQLINKKDNSLHGYFLEVDLDYLENLHEEQGFSNGI